MSGARLASRILLAVGAVLMLVCLWATFGSPEQARLAGTLSIVLGIVVIAAAALQFIGRKAT